MANVQEGPFQRIAAIQTGSIFFTAQDAVRMTKYSLPTFALLASRDDMSLPELLAGEAGKDLYAHESGLSTELNPVRLSQSDLSTQASASHQRADFGESAGGFRSFSFAPDGRLYCQLAATTNGDPEFWIRTIALDGQDLSIASSARTIQISPGTNNMNTTFVGPVVGDGTSLFFMYGYDAGPQDFTDLGTFVAKVDPATLAVVDTLTMPVETQTDRLGNVPIYALDFEGHLYIANALSLASGEGMRLYKVSTASMAILDSTKIIDTDVGEDEPFAIECDDAGNVYVSYRQSISFSNNDDFLQAWDADLNVLWTEQQFSPRLQFLTRGAFGYAIGEFGAVRIDLSDGSDGNSVSVQDDVESAALSEPYFDRAGFTS